MGYIVLKGAVLPLFCSGGMILFNVKENKMDVIWGGGKGSGETYSLFVEGRERSRIKDSAGTRPY
jgi:hypothetical protein